LVRAALKHAHLLTQGDLKLKITDEVRALALKAISEGRDAFTPQEQARAKELLSKQAKSDGVTWMT
jgi:hypothetical protein